eukprot:scaffold93146_cov31-Tisochrysis_lutea.AAC.1
MCGIDARAHVRAGACATWALRLLCTRLPMPTPQCARTTWRSQLHRLVITRAGYAHASRAHPAQARAAPCGACSPRRCTEAPRWRSASDGVALPPLGRPDHRDGARAIELCTIAAYTVACPRRAPEVALLDSCWKGRSYVESDSESPCFSSEGGS